MELKFASFFSLSFFTFDVNSQQEKASGQFVVFEIHLLNATRKKGVLVQSVWVGLPLLCIIVFIARKLRHTCI